MQGLGGMGGLGSLGTMRPHNPYAERPGQLPQVLHFNFKHITSF